MRRYLVVAHRTLGGEPLIRHLRFLREQGPCQFHLVVPVYHPFDHTWTEGEVNQVARDRLEAIQTMLAEMGIGATGEIGDADPMAAIDAVLRREGRAAFAGIVVSTLPRGLSTWWASRVPERIAKVYSDLHPQHIVCEHELVL